MEVVLKDDDLLRLIGIYLTESGIDTAGKSIDIRLRAGRKLQKNNAIIVNINNASKKEPIVIIAKVEEDTQLEIDEPTTIPGDPVEEPTETIDEPLPDDANLFGTDANDIEADESALEEGESDIVAEEANDKNIFGD